MQMKIIITGASGLLGRELMGSMREGNTLLGISHSRKKSGLRQLDIREPEALARLLRDFRPDIVVHNAAYRDPDFCEKNPEEALRLNVDPLKTICETVPASTRVILTSSDYVFDGKNPPYSENDERTAINFYAETKVMAEDILSACGNGLSLRVPVLIGRDDSFEESGFVYNMVKAVQSKVEVEINDINIRYPTWTRDVGRAFRFAVDQGLEGVLHFSGSEGGTQYDFALRTAEILEASHDHLKPLRRNDDRKAPRPLNSQLSCKLINSLGFENVTQYEKALRSIMSG